MSVILVAVGSIVYSTQSDHGCGLLPTLLYCLMSWHDDHSSGSPAEGQQGYRPRSTTGSPARRARRNDGYFYENDEDYRDDKSCSTDYVRSDDSNNSRIGGGSSARSDKIIDDGAYSASGDGSSCDWGSEETGGVGREDHGDAVVLRSLEEAISKYSATRRRPSTAVSKICCTTRYQFGREYKNYVVIPRSLV